MEMNKISLKSYNENTLYQSHLMLFSQEGIFYIKLCVKIIPYASHYKLKFKDGKKVITSKSAQVIIIKKG